jgi:hypothetical protein
MTNRAVPVLSKFFGNNVLTWKNTPISRVHFLNRDNLLVENVNRGIV